MVDFIRKLILYGHNEGKQEEKVEQNSTEKS